MYETYTFFEIAFDGSRSSDPDGTITFLWDFGDETTTDVDRPMHNWSDNGLYLVTLTVTDDDGESNSTTLGINILNRAPSVWFETSVIQGNVTTPIQCNATGTDIDGVIADWVWDFGDGNTSDEEDPVYFYGDDGEYVISLYVLDDDGAMSNVMNKSVVIENLPSVANMVINSYALEQLSLRTGISAEVIPNIMDFENPPPPPDDYCSDVRQALGISDDELFVLQPTRVVPRKWIERAVELISLLDLKKAAWLFHMKAATRGTYMQGGFWNTPSVLALKLYIWAIKLDHPGVSRPILTGNTALTMPITVPIW